MGKAAGWERFQRLDMVWFAVALGAALLVLLPVNRDKTGDENRCRNLPVFPAAMPVSMSWRQSAETKRQAAGGGQVYRRRILLGKYPRKFGIWLRIFRGAVLIAATTLSGVATVAQMSGHTDSGEGLQHGAHRCGALAPERLGDIVRLSPKCESRNGEITGRLVRLSKRKKGDAGASPLSGAY